MKSRQSGRTDKASGSSTAAETALERECSFALLDLRECKLGRVRLRLSVIDSKLPLVGASGKQQFQYERNVQYGEVLIDQDSAAKAVQILSATAYPWTPSFSSPAMVRFNVPMIRDTRARAYLKLGERDKAIEEYKLIVKFGSVVGDHRIPLPKFRFELGRLYEEKGSRAEARAEYAKFLEACKNADKKLPEIAEANRRLKSLESKP